jgi:hypothetical protein
LALFLVRQNWFAITLILYLCLFATEFRTLFTLTNGSGSHIPLFISINLSADKIAVTRIVTGKTVDEVLQSDLFIPIWMPPNFVQFAEEIVETVSKDRPELGIEYVLKVIRKPRVPGDQERLVLVRFNLSPVMMYQQIDRRLDE